MLTTSPQEISCYPPWGRYVPISINLFIGHACPQLGALCLCQLILSPEGLRELIPNFFPVPNSFQQPLFGNSDTSSLSYHTPRDPYCNFFIFTPTYSRCKVSLLKYHHSDQAYNSWNIIQNLQHNLVFSALLSIIPWGRVPCWTLIWYVVLFCFCPTHQKRIFSLFFPSIWRFWCWLQIVLPSHLSQHLLRRWLKILWKIINWAAFIPPSCWPSILRNWLFVFSNIYGWFLPNPQIWVLLSLSAFLLKHCLFGLAQHKS